MADIDVGSGDLTITLGVSQGTMTMSTIDGLSFATGDGSDDSDIVFSSTLTATQTALDTLVYTPTTHYNGTDTLSVSISDGGNTGTGGDLSDSTSIGIIITSINDDVTATNTSQTLESDEDSIDNAITDIVLSDPDAEDASPDLYTISLTLSDADAGTLSADSGNGETFLTGVWSMTSVTLAEANTVLAAMTYTPTTDYDTDASIAVSIADSNGPSITDTITLDLFPENEAPTATNTNQTLYLMRIPQTML